MSYLKIPKTTCMNFICCIPKIDEENTTSLTSFQVIEGRQYYQLGNSTNFFPSDEIEAHRQQKTHYYLKHYWKGNFCSPVHENLEIGADVLEVGCGPGSWILDLVYKYPRSKFIGIDIGKMFPTDNIPENAEFIQHDLLDGLNYPNNTFDFVHQRLSLRFTQEQWESLVIPELAKATKPGGWVELVEADDFIMTKGPITQRFRDAMVGLFKKNGLNPHIGRELKTICETSGHFSKVNYETMLIPYGNRDGNWSQLALESAIQGLSAIKPTLVEHMNVLPDHYDALLEGMRKEADSMGTSRLLHRVCCQKRPEIPTIQIEQTE